MDEKEREQAFLRGIRANVRDRTRLLVDTRAEVTRMLEAAHARVRAILAGQPTDYQQWYLPQLQRSPENLSDSILS